ncbi:hypothetical protein BGZ46_001237 [Entomortierella lignicola]|nr:hypothetical protein BGZ46_001237 [Entomortierella lignicola]
MTSPLLRRSTSKSPPILPTEFLTPATPAPSHRSEKSIHISSSDIGVLRLSGQISQNDDRLPKPPSQLRKQGSGSDSSGSGSGSGAQNISLTEIPYLDESPAYSLGHPYSHGSTSGTSASSSKGIRLTNFQRESQSMEAIPSYPMESSMPDSGPENDVSYSHQSSHSSISYSVHNTSSDSASSKNNSFGTNTSGSMNSRSSDSQVSEMSFTNAETSTPRTTPVPNLTASQKSTPSDSDQNSSSSQLSPVSRTTRITKRSQVTHEIQNRSSGPSQTKPFPAIPENDVLETSDTQQTEPFGTDLSAEEVEAALFEAESLQDITQLYESDSKQDDDDASNVVLPTKGILAAIGLSPDVHPDVPSEKRTDKGFKEPTSSTSVDWSGQPFEYLSSDDDEASRSTVSNKLNLHISQSQANIVQSLVSRSRKQSGSTSAISLRETSSSSNTVAVVQKGHEHFDKLNEAVASASNDNTAENTSTESVSGQLEESTSSSKDKAESSVPVKQTVSSSQQSTPTNHESSEASPSSQQARPRRTTRRTVSNSQDLPSSQSSDSPHSTADSVLMRLRSAASQDADPEHVFSAVPKRRRPNAAETAPLHVVSSVGEEGEFWEGSERNADHPQEHRTRSRSGSLDICSYPEEFLSGQDLEEIFQLDSEDENPDHQEDWPASPLGSSQAETSSQPTKLLPRPRTSHTRELRRRSASQASPSTPPTRRTLRRLPSTTEALRSYKINESVWARWRKDYYAGIVASKDSEFYEIHFLDDDISYCTGTHMRPLKLRLGAEVLAAKTESMDLSATVQGIHMSADLEQSRVDVRFDDETEANLSIRLISLTEDMIAKLDKDINWDQDTRSVPEATPSMAESSVSGITRQTSSVSAPSGTPRKTKTIQLERSLSGQLTPSRRSRGDRLSTVGQSSPSRRGGGKVFSDHVFVLSLSKASGENLCDEISAKIKAGGGTILPDFPSTIDHRRNVSPNLLLIAHEAVRTPKYLDALAMNIPRISYRWIEQCIADRQLMSYHPYQLPTGMSKELGAIISSSTLDNRRVFDGLKIGICGSGWFRWSPGTPGVLQKQRASSNAFTRVDNPMPD